MRTFLIDTDTASDDAVALIMALRHPDVRVAAITVVAGNVPVEQATKNALYTAELCGRSDVPVYAGAAKPLSRECEHAHWFHGRDGLGDQNYPPPSRTCNEGDASAQIIRTIADHKDRVTLVTLGPLTNIAQALQRAPWIGPHTERCVIMGGAPCCEGNVTPAAEYNIWVDPEAARIVFESGMPIELVGWQLCRGDANLREADIAHVRSIDTPLAHFAIDCNRVAMEANRTQSGEIGIALPDPVAMAIALDPTICTSSSRHYVEVETTSELTRGMTVVDRLNVVGDQRNRGSSGNENAATGLWRNSGRKSTISVCWSLDIPRWKALLYRSLA